jgi:hydrogenase maturation factor
MRDVIYQKLGATRRDVIVGPRHGVDNAVVRIGKGKVMIVTADPLSYIPALGAQYSAWLSVNLIASDLATSALPPQYGIFDFNLPPNMPESAFTNYWKHFHDECRRLGIAIIGGHTGRYQGCDYTVIGGGVMYAMGPEDRYLTSGMGQVGDELILTKGAAIETTAVLARSFPKTVKRALGSKLFEKARTYLGKVSTVKDSLTATSVGVHQRGITAMHDATEGGVLAAAIELATASGLGAMLDLPSIPISEETYAICKLFHIDPLFSLSEGSLLISCKRSKSEQVISRLKSANIDSTVIGHLTKSSRICGFTEKGVSKLSYPKYDPYWKAYWTASKKHWK